ncbi:MAG: PTS-dependent dihydroxyacetone kinase, dihydroxyacetone-binding subunit DhaK [Arthrobacter sp.]|nr:PTS-dependent dihydroxyacetone kinase, dihydroxyacetone-binding subunit DhaK [Arthrobacter sp.]
MTRLFNEPAAFADEMTEGFVASHGRWVKRVSGGVVRNTKSTPDTVALVIGGGSGHYPAFAGLVGQGLAHGAAMGNLFASPSAQQIYNVAKAANNGAGVLLGYGNYAGDVLHFNQAQDRLRKEGIDCRSIAVADDVSSAPLAERTKRRGIAGDLTVFKVAAAAAEAGYSMDDVVAVAERANERTRSFGVAFTGCTLPGADQPLFSVPAGRMAVGMGIHGEPGIDETDVPTADELAELLVGKLITEIPDGVDTRGARVVPILNGLGSVKYEELFVVYRRVAQLLAEAGLEAVDPQVGELVTSFDMAGTSLTLFWLDEELETLWHAPADAPAFRRGAVTAEALEPAALSDFAETEQPIRTPAPSPATAPSGSSQPWTPQGPWWRPTPMNSEGSMRSPATVTTASGWNAASGPPFWPPATPPPAEPEPRPRCTSPRTPGPTRPAARRERCGAWRCGPSVTPWGTPKLPTPELSPQE